MGIMNGMTSLVEMVSNGFIPVVLNVHYVFFKEGIKCMSCFTDIEFGAFSSMNYIQCYKSGN